MPHNRLVDSDTLRQGAAHIHVERPLLAGIVRARKSQVAAIPTAKSVWLMAAICTAGKLVLPAKSRLPPPRSKPACRPCGHSRFR